MNECAHERQRLINLWVSLTGEKGLLRGLERTIVEKKVGAHLWKTEW